MTDAEHCTGCNDLKRIAVYVIYDKDGILDEYRIYFLKKLRPFVNHIVVTISGNLLDDEVVKLHDLADEIYCRENKGLLAKSWYDSINYIGWSKIDKYDELLLLNDSFFGPIYPLNDFFDSMEKSDSDLYGVMKNYEDKDITSIGGRPLGSGHFKGSLCYFYVIKNRLLHSNAFKKYWSSCPEIKNDWDTIFFVEIDFYDYVLNNGFKIDSYQDDCLKGYFFDTLSHDMFDLISKNKIPFVRIRPFGTDMKDILLFTDGSDPRRTLDYIKQNTDYDVDMIWNYLIRTKNMVDIYNQLQLQYLIDDSTCIPTDGKNIAIAISVDNIENVSVIDYYINQLPDGTTAYIASKSEIVIESFKKMNHENIQIIYRLIENNVPRDSLLWMTFSDIFNNEQYDYICFIHDVLSSYSGYAIHNDTMARRCYENLIGNKEIVTNIIKKFEDNDHLGMIMPPQTYSGDYFNSNLRGWMCNWGHVRFLMNFLEINVPIDQCKPPITAPGGMFWVRRKALSNLISKKVDIAYFNNLGDVDVCPTSTHYIYSLFIQNEGYFYATAYTEKYSRIDLSNFYYMLYKINKTILNSGNYVSNYSTTIKLIEQKMSTNPTDSINIPRYVKLTRTLKRYIPKKIIKIMENIIDKFFLI